MAFFKLYFISWCALNRSIMEVNEDLIIISVLQNLVSSTECHHTDEVCTILYVAVFGSPNVNQFYLTISMLSNNLVVIIIMMMI